MGYTIFQVDKGLIYTIKQLFICPGISIREYLEGKRRYYFRPLSYVLLLSTIYFLVTKGVGANTWLDDFLVGFANGASSASDEREMITQVQWFADNYAYTTLLLLPVFSFASYISFFGKGLNYAEHLVLNAYITGQQALLYSFSAILLSFVDYYYLETLPFLIALLYTFWVFYRFFNKDERWLNVLRTISVYVIYYILSSIIVIISFMAFKLISEGV